MDNVKRSTSGTAENQDEVQKFEQLNSAASSIGGVKNRLINFLIHVGIDAEEYGKSDEELSCSTLIETLNHLPGKILTQADKLHKLIGHLEDELL